MDKKLFELGLSKRRATLGSDYVNKNLESADEFNRQFQEQMTEWCWSLCLLFVVDDNFCGR